MKTIRNQFTHPRVTIIKSTENNKVGKVLEKNWTPLFTAGGNIK